MGDLKNSRIKKLQEANDCSIEEAEIIYDLEQLKDKVNAFEDEIDSTDEVEEMKEIAHSMIDLFKQHITDLLYNGKNNEA